MNLSSHVELGHVINKAAARTDRQTDRQRNLAARVKAQPGLNRYK